MKKTLLKMDAPAGLSIILKSLSLHNRLDLKELILPVLLFFITFFIYLNNLSPTVFAGDTGDFLSAIMTYGIAHPSGYPLYTLTGILLNTLPFGESSAWRIGIGSAVFASLAVLFMYYLSLELTKDKKIALITAFILAFLYPFWIYAEVAEVFSLHSLFILAVSFLSVKFTVSKDHKYIYWLAFIFGLSLTNNLTIVLMFPGLILSILLTEPKIIKNFRMIFFCFILFLIGLLPYLYIPLAASRFPVVNWDKALTVKNFIELILRKDYGWIHSDSNPFFPQEALYAFFIYWREYASLLFLPLFILGFLGFIVRKKTVILIYLVVTLLFLGPVFIIYAKAPTNTLSSLSTLERFYTSPMIIIIIFFSQGILFFIKLLQSVIKNSRLKSFIYTFVIISLSTLPVSLFIYNVDRTDLSSVFIGEELAKDVLRPLEPNSFLFVVNDEFAFNTLYVQYEHGFRTDITIPGRNTGFEKFLTTSKVIEPDDIKIYLINNRNTLKQEELFGGIVSLLESGYAVYSTIPKLFIDNDLGKLGTIPHGLVYKFVIGNKSIPDKTAYITEQDRIWSNFNIGMFEKHRNVVGSNLSLSNIKRHYAEGYKNIANFMKLYYNDEELYQQYLDRAVKIDPILTDI